MWEGQYWPFGDVYTQDTDPDLDGAHVYQPFRFPGQFEDFETGLYYNYFRDYDPTLGRYIEADPIGLGKEMNNYIYGGDSPITMIDRLGLAYYTGEVIYGSGVISKLSNKKLIGPGGGAMKVTLQGLCINGERKIAEYVVLMGGVTAGLRFGISTFTFDYDDERESWFPDFERFEGFAALFSITTTAGNVGISTGTLWMGKNAIHMTGKAKGFDFSGDFFFGGSIKLKERTECCTGGLKTSF